MCVWWCNKQRAGEARAQFSNVIIAVVVSGGGDCINVACGVTTRVFLLFVVGHENNKAVHTTTAHMSNYTWHMMTSD